MRKTIAAALLAALITTATRPAGAETFPLPDGSQIIVGQDGLGMRVDASGRMVHAVSVVRPFGYKPAIGGVGPDAVAIQQRLVSQRGRIAVPGEVIVVFRDFYNAAYATTDPSLSAILRAAQARPLEPLFGNLRLNRFGQAYLMHIGAGTPEAVARALRASNAVAYAEPNFFVSSLATDPHVISSSRQERARTMAASMRFSHRQTTLPANYGLQSSLQSFLNASSINAVGAYPALARSGELPGHGEIVTNVSIGDLTDAAMAHRGDPYVQQYGPTTVINGGQRYLDIPSFPLIPTFTADKNGNLNPLGSVEGDDPFLGEVLLDFSVMAPLPDNLQRPGAQGSGLTDLLGIAPGAQYRLVVPHEPTIANIDAALLGAAMQNPKPDIITTSLGFGTDTNGFPSRYLEEDPLTQALIASIVSRNIVVCVAGDDGTRLFTNAAVNPDGGSTPTDIVQGTATPTSIADDALSTTPGEIPDSGALDVGGSTLDDIFVAPPEDGGLLGSLNAFPETRLDGELDFSSGFGSRVNVSAPSDNIPSMIHHCACGGALDPTAVDPVLEGGTSASAPETAATAAVVLQAAKLAGKSLTPMQLRDLMIATGRKLHDPQQLDAAINVGPQIDLTAAIDTLLNHNGATPQVVRVAIAQRQELGDLGGEFEENTDPTNIDLGGLDSGGENQVSPITIAPDWYGIPANAHYALFVTGRPGRLSTNRWARLMPQVILTAAGQPFVSMSTRTVSLTYEARVGFRTVARATFPLTFGPNDGTYYDSLAPQVPPQIPLGTGFTVKYDLTGVRNVQNPQLIVSSVGHWNPFTAPLFRIAHSVPISRRKDSVWIPASVLAEGAGIYGVGILINSAEQTVGRFAPLLVSASSPARPPAPGLAVSTETPGHYLAVNRQHPGFTITYDVSKVRGASGAMLEISAPGPNLYALANVFENAFGTMRDDNGVDTASTVYKLLSGLNGSIALDAGKLGLPSSLVYTVRVLAVSGSTVAGEASPVSTLEYDDAISPGGADINAFDVEPTGTSAISTVSFDGSSRILAESAVYPYQSGTESYGSAFIADKTGQTKFHVIGEDAKLGQIGTIELTPPTVSSNVEKFIALDATTGARLATVPLQGGTAQVLTGRIDAVRHRAAILQYPGATSTTILPIDLKTESPGPAIATDTSSFSHAGQPNAMDFDPTSGLLYLTAENAGSICQTLPSAIESLDLTTRHVSAEVSLPSCLTGIAASQTGSSVYLMQSPRVGAGGGPLLVPATLLTVQESPLQLGATSTTVADFGCLMPVEDPVAHLTIVGCIAPRDFVTNNASMSVIDVIDETTHTMRKRIPIFNFAYAATTDTAYTDRGIQLDPTTRIGWTYSPFGDALQQFAY